jgi:hypothetical protein
LEKLLEKELMARALVIHSTKYGAGAIQIETAPILRNMIHMGKIDVPVENSTFGTDPVENVHKSLTVEYSIGLDGPVQRIVKSEHERLQLP